MIHICMFIMNLRMCKGIIFSSFENPTFLYKSHLSFLFFSTSPKKQTNNTLTVYDFLLHKHQFSPEAASQVASVLPRIKNPEKPNSKLLFLKESGFSKKQLEKIVKTRPGLLAASLEKTIKPKIKIFQDFGFSADDTAEIISNYPRCLCCSANNRFIPTLSVLKSLLGSSSEVAKVLKISGWYLNLDLKKTLVTNIEFLRSCGVDKAQIIRQMYVFPRLLLHTPIYMKRFVIKVDEMGICRSSRLFIYAVRVVSSMTDENWELKLKHFSNLRFSKDEILKMFKMSPSVFAESQRKLKEVKEVLLATGKYDISCIVNNPRSFNCSVEKKIKPRMQVLGILDSRNLIKKWPSLSTITRMPEREFLEKFVQPHLNEVGQAYMANSALNRGRDPKLLSSA